MNDCVYTPEIVISLNAIDVSVDNKGTYNVYISFAARAGYIMQRQTWINGHSECQNGVPTNNNKQKNIREKWINSQMEFA